MGKITDVKINFEIKDIIKKNKLPMEDTLSYLVCLYYDLFPSYIPIDLQRKIFQLGIVEQDLDLTLEEFSLKWNIPLFNNLIQEEFDWIDDWLLLFKEKNPSRRGVKKQCLDRFKAFFRDFPNITKEDVFKATKYYLDTLTDPMYCRVSQRFIFDKEGVSLLKEYIDRIPEINQINTSQEEDIL